MKAYSQDLRERVVRACDERRGSRPQIAELFGVSTAWIRRLLQRRRQTGSFAAKPHAGGRVKMDQVREQPDATLAELRDRLAAPVHSSTIARALRRLAWTVKKSPPRRGARAARRAAPARPLPRPGRPGGPRPPRLPRRDRPAHGHD